MRESIMNGRSYIQRCSHLLNIQDISRVFDVSQGSEYVRGISLLLSEIFQQMIFRQSPPLFFYQKPFTNICKTQSSAKPEYRHVVS